MTSSNLLVVGEALVDLVLDTDAAVTAVPGGAPFNTARAAARLGTGVAFAGTLANDRFAAGLIDALTADGVDITPAARVDVPTTLAAAELNPSGAASYRFYFDGTSAPLLDRVDPAAADAATVWFTGGLALVLEPMATAVEAWLASRAQQLVMIDVNCRPLVIAQRADYVERIDRAVAHADIVKVSDEDLDYLRPGADPLEAAAEIVGRGPGAVLVTRGGDGVDVVTAATARTVPVEPVEVVDTVGAGDSFSAGLLAWWVANGLGRAEVASIDRLVRAVQAANRVAAITVTRRGADPPTVAELGAGWAD